MNFLKRRFSDLGPNLLDTIANSTQEVINQVNNNPGQQQQQQQQQHPSGGPPTTANNAPYRVPGHQLQNIPGGVTGTHPSFQHPPTTQPRSDLSKPGAGSAPSSPPEQRKVMQHQNSQQSTGGGGGVGGFFSSLTQKAANVAETAKNAALPKIKILLVIDDTTTDWNKYFRGRKLLGEYDIRVEQAEFQEISVKSHSDSGATVDLHMSRGGPKVVRTFRPDFVLVRQQPKSSSEDYTHLLVALQFGCVPAVNSLGAIYNFQNKPWTFAQLVSLQRKLGKEKFPLIEQVFFPTYKQMLNEKPKFPVVLKVGHEHNGVGKVKVENAQSYEEVTGLVKVTNTFCTSEPFVDSKFDFRIQKIGQQYKVYMRTSSSAVWQSNMGSAVVEQVNMNDTFRMWMDQVSELFGGLDMCAISALRGRDNKDYIIEVNDCCLPLIGDKQEEDRKAIADLVLLKMEHMAKAAAVLALSPTPTPPAAAAAATPTAPPTSNALHNDSKFMPNDVGSMSKRPEVSSQPPPPQYKQTPPQPTQQQSQQAPPSSQAVPQRPSAPSPATSSVTSTQSPSGSRASVGSLPQTPSGSVGSLSGKQGHQLPPTPQQPGQASPHNVSSSAPSHMSGSSNQRPSSRHAQQQQHQQTQSIGNAPSRAGGVANYYVAGGASLNQAHTPHAPYTNQSSLRLSRFGRKVMAVSRLKKAMTLLGKREARVSTSQSESTTGLFNGAKSIPSSSSKAERLLANIFGTSSDKRTMSPFAKGAATVVGYSKSGSKVFRLTKLGRKIYLMAVLKKVKVCKKHVDEWFDYQLSVQYVCF